MPLNIGSVRALRNALLGGDAATEVYYAVDKSRKIYLSSDSGAYFVPPSEGNGAIIAVAPRTANLTIQLPARLTPLQAPSINVYRVVLLGDVADDAYVQVATSTAGDFIVGAATILKTGGGLAGFVAVDADECTAARFDGVLVGGKRGDWMEFRHLETGFFHVTIFGRSSADGAASPFTLPS